LWHHKDFLGYYLIEALICLPFTPPFVEWEYTFHQLGTHSTLSLDDMVCMWSFLRLYNLAKVVREHSYLRKPAAFELCRMFRFTPRWNFVLKGILFEHRYKLMAIMTVITCLFGAYTLRILERTSPNDRLGNIYHCIWLLSVTQMTIGYGDLVPSTQLGRLIGSLLAFFSIIVMSFVVFAIKVSAEMGKKEGVCLDEQS
jgi:hypothetical protein